MVPQMPFTTTLDANSCRWSCCHDHTVPDVHQHGLRRQVRSVGFASRPVAPMAFFVNPILACVRVLREWTAFQLPVTLFLFCLQRYRESVRSVGRVAH